MYITSNNFCKISNKVIRGARKRSLYLAELRIQNYSLQSIGIYVESWVRSCSCDRSNENSSRIPHFGLNFAASSTSTTTTTMPVRFHYRPASISTRLLSRHAPFPPPPSYARRPRCTYAREKTTSAAALKYARRRLARERGTHALLLHCYIFRIAFLSLFRKNMFWRGLRMAAVVKRSWIFWLIEVVETMFEDC